MEPFPMLNTLVRGLNRALLTSLILSLASFASVGVAFAKPVGPAAETVSATTMTKKSAKATKKKSKKNRGTTKRLGPKAKGRKGQRGKSKKTPRLSVGERIVRTAAAQAGDPYRYGAAGPHAFDCSGLVLYSAKRNGKHLPRTSSAQRGATRRIAFKDRRRGDLVFFHGSSGVYHVGIYAGMNTIWHAPYTGARVRKERIWTSAVSYGRVR